MTKFSGVAPRRSSKAFAKTKLIPKKDHGHCLVVCCPSDPLPLLESRWNHCIWEVAQQINEMNWKMQCLQLALVNRKGAILYDNTQLHITQQMLQKLNWAKKFCLICHIHSAFYQLTTISSSILTTSCSENTLQPAGCWKCLLNPEAWIFMLQEYINLFLVGKNLLVVMVPILINKDVCESSYNDLKFTVQSCNYFFINLINILWVLWPSNFTY